MTIGLVAAAAVAALAGLVAGWMASRARYWRRRCEKVMQELRSGPQRDARLWHHCGRLLVLTVSAARSAALTERVRLMTEAYDLKDDAAEKAIIARKARWLDLVDQADEALTAHSKAWWMIFEGRKA